MMENCDYEVLVCPFCGDDDFDLIGLKHHYLHHCDEYNETKLVDYPKGVNNE